jgi:hypothetical protein
MELNEVFLRNLSTGSWPLFIGKSHTNKCTYYSWGALWQATKLQQFHVWNTAASLTNLEYNSLCSNCSDNSGTSQKSINRAKQLVPFFEPLPWYSKIEVSWEYATNHHLHRIIGNHVTGHARAPNRSDDIATAHTGQPPTLHVQNRSLVKK